MNVIARTTAATMAPARLDAPNPAINFAGRFISATRMRFRAWARLGRCPEPMRRSYRRAAQRASGVLLCLFRSCPNLPRYSVNSVGVALPSSALDQSGQARAGGPTLVDSTQAGALAGLGLWSHSDQSSVTWSYALHRYAFRKTSRSALIVSACVVGMPWGKPL